MKRPVADILTDCRPAKLRDIAVIRLAMQGNVMPYSIMMRTYRPDREAVSDLAALLEAYEHNRFSTGAHPIKLGRGGEPIDGHHRIAYASLHGVEVVTVEETDEVPKEWGSDWYALHGLEDWRELIEGEVKKCLYLRPDASTKLATR